MKKNHSANQTALHISSFISWVLPVNGDGLTSCCEIVEFTESQLPIEVVFLYGYCRYQMATLFVDVQRDLTSLLSSNKVTHYIFEPLIPRDSHRHDQPSK